MNPADNKVRYSTYLACLNKSANRFGGIDRKEEESSDSTVGSPCPPPSLSLGPRLASRRLLCVGSKASSLAHSEDQRTAAAADRGCLSVGSPRLAQNLLQP